MTFTWRRLRTSRLHCNTDVLQTAVANSCLARVSRGCPELLSLVLLRSAQVLLHVDNFQAFKDLVTDVAFSSAGNGPQTAETHQGFLSVGCKCSQADRAIVARHPYCLWTRLRA